MNESDTTAITAAAPTAQPEKSPLHAIVDVATWLWPRRRLLVAELRAAQARSRTPKSGKAENAKLRFQD